MLKKTQNIVAELLSTFVLRPRPVVLKLVSGRCAERFLKSSVFTIDLVWTVGLTGERKLRFTFFRRWMD